MQNSNLGRQVFLITKNIVAQVSFSWSFWVWKLPRYLFFDIVSFPRICVCVCVEGKEYVALIFHVGWFFLRRKSACGEVILSKNLCIGIGPSYQENQHVWNRNSFCRKYFIHLQNQNEIENINVTNDFSASGVYLSVCQIELPNLVSA